MCARKESMIQPIQFLVCSGAETKTEQSNVLCDLLTQFIYPSSMDIYKAQLLHICNFDELCI